MSLDFADPNTMMDLFDPYQALPPGAWNQQPLQGGVRLRQRARKPHILATTRQLLGQSGCEEVTVREISRASGCALQTIYNLVGPRSRAIADAISEYSLFVGRMAARRHPDLTLLNLVDMWVMAAEACPEFVRECNLIIFTPSREIYYHFRDAQLIGVAKLLRRQKASGRISYLTPTRQLAEQIVFFATAMWIDWADRPFPLQDLRMKLINGMIKLMRD
jgi:AcrR family transcriptional regulator